MTKTKSMLIYYVKRMVIMQTKKKNQFVDICWNVHVKRNAIDSETYSKNNRIISPNEKYIIGARLTYASTKKRKKKEKNCFNICFLHIFCFIFSGHNPCRCGAFKIIFISGNINILMNNVIVIHNRTSHANILDGYLKRLLWSIIFHIPIRIMCKLYATREKSPFTFIIPYMHIFKTKKTKILWFLLNWQIES